MGERERDKEALTVVSLLMLKKAKRGTNFIAVTKKNSIAAVASLSQRGTDSGVALTGIQLIGFRRAVRQKTGGIPLVRHIHTCICIFECLLVLYVYLYIHIIVCLQACYMYTCIFVYINMFSISV